MTFPFAASAAACWIWETGQARNIKSADRQLTNRNRRIPRAKRPGEMRMNTRTNASLSDGPASAAQHKPRFSLFIATAGGLGYLPKAPGTWGSFAGILLAMLPWWALFAMGAVSENKTIYNVSFLGGNTFDPYLDAQIWIAIITAIAGVWAASSAARFWRRKDPQRVVVDEVSGQHLTLLLGCGVPIWWRAASPVWIGITPGLIRDNAPLSWKYLVLGLILFRVFDIWKPFPARRAESLPGGWGIMADDWIAAIYAAIGLWAARAAGL